MNLPDLLTLVRILLIPVVLALYLVEARLPAAAIFAVAAVTDWLDGYLARRLNQSTPFGAFFDPVADKLMVASVLVLLAGAWASPWISIPVLLVIGREILVSALREWLAQIGQRATVAVSWLGKVKTTVQFVAILVLLAVPPGFVAAPPGDGTLAWAGVTLLYAAAVLTLWSGADYLQAAAPALRGSRDASG